jgi:hypothetical protein
MKMYNAKKFFMCIHAQSTKTVKAHSLIVSSNMIRPMVYVLIRTVIKTHGTVPLVLYVVQCKNYDIDLRIQEVLT